MWVYIVLAILLWLVGMIGEEMSKLWMGTEYSNLEFDDVKSMFLKMAAEQSIDEKIQVYHQDSWPDDRIHFQIGDERIIIRPCSTHDFENSYLQPVINEYKRRMAWKAAKFDMVPY